MQQVLRMSLRVFDTGGHRWVLDRVDADETIRPTVPDTLQTI